MNLKQTSDSGKRLKAVINTVIDGVITIDQSGIIETVNPAAARLFLYSSEELLGQNISILMPEPHRSSHDQYLRNYLKTKKAKIIGIGREVEGRRKDGTMFPIRLAVSELRLDNDEIIFTGIIHDLTEIKRAEKELITLNQELETIIGQRTQKLNEVINRLLDLNRKFEHEIDHRKKVEEALRDNQSKLTKMLDREKELNELKSRFLSMASHEFKTPLSTILSSASLIRKYSLEEHLEKRTKHIDRIRNSVEHLDAILNDFLSLSKLEENRIEVNTETFDLAQLCQEVSDEMRGQLKSGQEIEYLCPEEDLKISTDRRVLKNILFNLISNASKYSGEHKTIFCRTSKTDGRITIAIEDQGMGIPLEDQKHLFTRFFRATNAINIKGTGLGLHIVQQYLNLLEGGIDFTSEQGKGSIFTIYLNQP
ncbi:MAG: PAS domain-containing sensor histidine kinase [Saprospiraceae bacterium]|nr:PAS domain-containing sensor histidine kinase [Saprospiraceae bacterium]